MLTRLVFVAATTLLVAPLASAQQEDPDFLFGIPGGAISVRGGYKLASTNSEVYELFFEDLTIQPSDFNTFVSGLDGAITMHPRVDLLVGVEHSLASIDSEHRDFEEDNGAPVVQNTKLRTISFTGSFKVYVTPRGRDISRFAFVPNKARVYVGGGAGALWYKLEQVGDFIDFTDLAIFTGQFLSSGWSLETHVFTGLDLQVSRRVYLSLEGRYVWADANLSGDFVGFDPIDLNGLRLTAGIGFTF